MFTNPNAGGISGPADFSAEKYGDGQADIAFHERISLRRPPPPIERRRARTWNLDTTAGRNPALLNSALG
jgi:hypothetical protein